MTGVRTFLLHAVCLLLSPALVFAQAQAEAPAIPGTTPALDQLRAQAEQAYTQGQYPRAIELSSQVLAQNGKDHMAYYLRASSRVELGQQQRDLKLVRSGIEDSREALKAGGTTEINYYLPYLFGMTTLAGLENRREHVDTVLKQAETLLKRTNLDPEDRANILYQKAGAALFLRQTDAALADYQLAIDAYPKHMGAHVAMADALVAAQRLEEADKAFNATVAAFPTMPLVVNNRGMFRQQRGRSAEAIADFSKALELDATYYVALTNRGFTHLQTGNSAAAEEDLTRSLQINPAQALAHSLRGTARLNSGNAKSAIEDYQQVIRLDPNNAVAHGDMGFAKFFSRDVKGAAEAFQQAVTLDAKLKYLNPWRYWSYTLLGNKAAAADVATEHNQKPADAREWVDHLVLYLDNKITDQELVDKVAVNEEQRKNMQLCEAYYFLGERRLVAGDREGAAVAYREALGTKATQLSAFRGSQYQLKVFK